MKSRIIKIFFAAFIAIVSVSAQAATETVNGITWTYTVSNGKASVGGGYSSSPAVPKTTSGTITIPLTLGGYPVTSIEYYAFEGCSSLMSVTIGKSVTSIGDYAFSGCRSLQAIIVDVDNNNYKSLDGLLLSKDGKILVACPGAKTSVVIPDSVTSIEFYAFHGCRSLQAIIVDVDNNNYKSLDGLLLSKDGKILVECPGAKTSVVIPDSVTSILDAFYNCSSLTSVTIPDSVTVIYEGTFSSCSSLTSVTIGDSVTIIGDAAFYNCSSLTSITIPDSVTRIGGGAFYNCSSLTSVTIGDSVTSISSGAFYNCSSLTSVTIGKSVTSVEDEAFYGCSSLTSVTIPDSVTSIGDYAFYGCSSLTSVTIPDSVTSIGDYAFLGCSSLTSVTIPDSVTSIGEDAFEGCSSIKTATLPGWDCGITLDQVTNIVISAGTKIVRAEGFSGCTSLESVSIPEGVTQIDSNAFSGCSSLKTVLIPDSVTYVQGSAFDGTPFGGKIYAETVKLVSQKLSDDSGSQGGSSGSSEGGGAAVTPPVNADLGYNLTESVEDRSISNVEINGDRALDEFVLKDGKVYDCVLRIVNVSDNAAKVILPKKYVYEKFRGTNPLLIPAASTNLLTITRTKADTFFISREELALEVQE